MAQTAKKSTSTSSSGKKTGTASKANVSPFPGLPPEMEQFFFTPTSNEAMEKLMTQNKSNMDKMAKDASDIGREGFEAVIKSSGIFMKGFEEILRTVTTITQSAAEKQQQFVKEALSSKTLNEWTEVQNKIAQANFDDFMSGATKISEMSVKMLTECAEPLNAQLTKTMKKAGSAVAA